MPEEQTITDVKPVVDSSTPTTPDVKIDTVAPSAEVKVDVKEPETPQDVIANVLKDYPKGEQDSSSQKQGEVEKDDVKEEPVVSAETVEEPKHEEAVPYQRFEEVNRRAKEYEEPAGRMRSIEAYCAQHQITADSFATALDLLGAMNSDPKRARELLKPLVEQLDVITGEGIPSDLKDEVADGIMTIERAKELAKLRLTEKQAVARQEQQQAQWQQQRQQSLNNTLSTWLASKQKLHIEFKPKADQNTMDGQYEAFMRRFNTYWSTIPVHSPEEAVALAERALKEEFDYVKQFKPAPVDQKVLRSTGSSTTATPQIDTTKEGWGRQVAQQVLAQY